MEETSIEITQQEPQLEEIEETPENFLDSESPADVSESVSDETSHEETTQQESTQQESTQQESTQQESTQQESTQQENAEEQTTAEQTTAEQTTAEQTAEEQTTAEQTTAEQTTEEEEAETETDTNNYLTITDLEMFSNPVNFLSVEPTEVRNSELTEYEITVLEKLDNAQVLLTNILAVNIAIGFAVFMALGVKLANVLWDRLRG